MAITFNHATHATTGASNTLRRKALALLAVPALAVPSAMGVYSYLAPESGQAAAISAAIGFEALYVGTNVLIYRSPELRMYARNVALAAVATAVLFNTLAHYAAKVPNAYTGAAFQPLAFVLALVASVPLAGLAYSASVLLHRLSEDEAQPSNAAVPTTTQSAIGENLDNDDLQAGQPEAAHTALHATNNNAAHATPVSIDAGAAITYTCPQCASSLSRAQWLAAKRWGHCRACKVGAA